MTNATKFLQPDNLNTFQANKFKLVFKRIPNTTFFCQNITLPGLTLGEVSPVPTPFSTMKTPGNRLTFEILSVGFILDEDLANYLEIFRWMVGLGFPKTFTQFENLKNTVIDGAKLSDLQNKDSFTMSDAVVMLLTNKGNPNIEFRFSNCFPTQLDGVELTATEEPQAVVVRAQFAYSTYDIVRVGTDSQPF